MTSTETIKMFPITACPKWSYVTKTHFGTCVVDGMQITMRFKVKLVNPIEVPDVLAIEEFCKEMGQHKDTLEGYVAKLAVLLGCTVTGRDGNARGRESF